MPVFASTSSRRQSGALFGVIGARGIAGRRADAAILLVDQVRVAQVFAAAVAPFVAHALVQAFGEGLGQAVGERLGHDGVVVVVLGAESVAELLQADAGGHREGADVIGQAGLLRRDEIGQRAAGLAAFAVRLLAQEVERVEHLRARRVGVQLDVVAHALAGKKPYTPRAVSSFFAMIRSSSALASAKICRACSPYFSCSRMRG